MRPVSSDGFPWAHESSRNILFAGKEADGDETVDEDACTDELMIRSIVRDLLKMTV